MPARNVRVTTRIRIALVTVNYKNYKKKKPCISPSKEKNRKQQLEKYRRVFKYPKGSKEERLAGYQPGSIDLTIIAIATMCRLHLWSLYHRHMYMYNFIPPVQRVLECCYWGAMSRRQDIHAASPTSFFAQPFPLLAIIGQYHSDNMQQAVAVDS